jgi:hypothetical protein
MSMYIVQDLPILGAVFDQHYLLQLPVWSLALAQAWRQAQFDFVAVKSLMLHTYKGGMRKPDGMCISVEDLMSLDALPPATRELLLNEAHVKLATRSTSVLDANSTDPAAAAMRQRLTVRSSHTCLSLYVLHDCVL